MKRKKEKWTNWKVFKDICFDLWGCIPRDPEWALNSPLFKAEVDRRIAELEEKLPVLPIKSLKTKK